MPNSICIYFNWSNDTFSQKFGLLFVETLDEAKRFCERFRPTLHPIYNPNRNRNYSIPPAIVDFDGEQEQHEEQEEKFIIPHVEMDRVDIMTIDNLINGMEMSAESSGGVSGETNNDSVSELEINIDQLASTSSTSCNSNLVGTQKDLLELSEENAIDDVDSLPTDNFENEEATAFAMHANEEEEVTVTLDDDIEMTHVLNKEYRPKLYAFEVKKNDILSGTLPFSEV